MENTKTDTLVNTHRAISEILRDYVADEDARLELDYKIFCVLKTQMENLIQRTLYFFCSRNLVHLQSSSFVFTRE